CGLQRRPLAPGSRARSVVGGRGSDGYSWRIGGGRTVRRQGQVNLATSMFLARPDSSVRRDPPLCGDPRYPNVREAQETCTNLSLCAICTRLLGFPLLRLIYHSSIIKISRHFMAGKN